MLLYLFIYFLSFFKGRMDLVCNDILDFLSLENSLTQKILNTCLEIKSIMAHIMRTGLVLVTYES